MLYVSSRAGSSVRFSLPRPKHAFSLALALALALAIVYVFVVCISMLFSFLLQTCERVLLRSAEIASFASLDRPGHPSNSSASLSQRSEPLGLYCRKCNSILHCIRRPHPNVLRHRLPHQRSASDPVPRQLELTLPPRTTPTQTATSPSFPISSLVWAQQWSEVDGVCSRGCRWRCSTCECSSRRPTVGQHELTGARS